MRSDITRQPSAMSMIKEKTKVNNIAAVLLAGGENRRMGRNKALLKLGKQTFLEHLTQFAQAHTTHIAVSVHDDLSLSTDLPILHDHSSNRLGPLSGIRSGLQWLQNDTPCDWLLSLPVDTPYLPSNLVETLSLPEPGSHKAKYVKYLTREHYLICLWHKQALTTLNRYLQQGQRSVRGFISELNGISIDCSPRHNNDPRSDLMCFNINTPKDLSIAQKLYGEL